jgi:hypothetical protein
MKAIRRAPPRHQLLMARTKCATISTAKKLMTTDVVDMSRSSLLRLYADHVPQRHAERHKGQAF